MVEVDGGGRKHGSWNNGWSRLGSDAPSWLKDSDNPK
jgi:hypothetical protein